MRATRFKGKSWSGMVAILALAVAGTALSLVIHDRATKKPLEETRLFEMEHMITMTGLNRPVTNRLDPAFVDKNDDLVADASDAKDQLDPPTLKFCYIVEDSDEDMKAIFADLLSAIATATGKPVEYQAFEDTESQLRAIQDGSLMIAGLGTGTVPIAVDAAGFIPLARFADTSGVADYQMEVIVPADSPVQKLEDLKKRSLEENELTCTDPSSNSGFKAAILALKNTEMYPARDYRIIYSGSHALSIKAISDKSAKIACVANDILQLELAKGTISANQFRSIYKSSSFPTAAIGLSCKLKPEVAAKIREVVLNFQITGTSLEKKFVPQGRTKLIPVNYKNDWALIRQFDQDTGTEHSLR